MARAERLGVEQVPPLQHDKHGEEHRELAYGDLAPAVEPYQHAEQGGEEQYAHRADGPRHVGVYDEVGLLAGLLVHHLVRRRQRCQRHGGEGVHDEVDPQYLGDGQRQLGAGNGASEHEQQRRDVDHELEEDEPLYVLVQRAAPLDGAHDAAEGVVDESHVAGVLGHARARAERQAHVGVVERRGVVGAVARDTSPRFCSRLTSRCLSVGLARLITRSTWARS